MTEEISFEEAKTQAIKKWESIVRRIRRLQGDIIKECGFCQRHEIEESNDLDCDNCEAFDICNLYDVRGSLLDAGEEAKEILNNVEKLEE